jgi:C-terminal processing protease CtpA/Prc
MLRLVLALTLIAVPPLGAALRSAEMSDRFAIAATMGFEDQHNPFPVGWEDYRAISLDAVLEGTDNAWAEDLQTLVDGKPVAEAVAPSPVLTSDRRFDGGSGLALTELSQIQIANLTTLGKVWGFLKYHHPAVTSGKLHWDYELLHVLPNVLEQRDMANANAAMAKWISGLGTTDPCNPCARLNDSDLHLRPDIAWIEDESLLGPELSRSLRAIHANRPRLRQQLHVSLADARNPTFHEFAYKDLAFPDPGYQLLALYRFWNIIQYWFPYRDVIGEDWHKVLSEFVPRIALAKDKHAYKLELIGLIARIHDTHANLWSGLDVRPPTGPCRIPATVRFIEGRAVVTDFVTPEAVHTSGLKIADIIASLDDVPVESLVKQWAPYYAASNEPTRMRDIGRSMTLGECGDVSVSVIREGREIKVTTARLRAPEDGRTHDLPGETFRLLSPDVAYLKLSSAKRLDAARYVEAAAGTKGLVIDIRNYPSESVVYTLGSLLVDQRRPFVRFTEAELSTPGAFRWTSPVSIAPRAPHYTGKVAILVDEISQSHSEFTAMAFRSARNAVVVGSTTAAADGNLSDFLLPGGEFGAISGIGVFYPDKRPTQRIGIVPDIEARPTIAGIRSGRDEVVEAALRHILGNTVSDQEIQRMAQR